MRHLRDDRGAALIMVILLGFIAMLLVGTGLTVATSGLRQAVSSQRSTSALDAAFAGVQEYLARVNADDGYVAFGNTDAPFSKSSVVASTMKRPTVRNPAMGWGLAGTKDWPGAVVPGSGGVATFRYEVDNSSYKSTGVVRLRVTGLAGERTRTLLANLRVRGFVDFSYFTDLEMQDPQITGAPDTCAVRYTARTAITNWKTVCGAPIRFMPDDIVSGDVHSNDRMIICGTTFQDGRVTTYYSGSPLYGSDTSPTSYENCPSKKTIAVTRADALDMPATNTSMKADADAANAGCLYTGPTQVTYTADGKMTVVSPWTQSTRSATRCGSVAALRTPAGATVPQLDHDLLYVQNVPDTYGAAQMPSGLKCIDAAGATSSSTNGIGWSLSGSGSDIRYPLTGENPASVLFDQPTAQWSTTQPSYGCRNGDLYIKGRVTTQTTSASANSIYVTGDITYEDTKTDVLGLVAENTVLVWNPFGGGTYKDDGTGTNKKRWVGEKALLIDSNRQIQAAIVSVTHTFQAQNYDRGTTMRGQLQVFGSIAQKFRGPVSAEVPDTGYDKAYQYDPLLKTVSPPKFLAPGSTIFSVTFYAGVPAAFDANGRAR